MTVRGNNGMFIFSSLKGCMMVNSNFIRRQNPDSTVDVICLSCFRTIAYSQVQTDLSSVENSHGCTPLDEQVLFHSDKLPCFQW
jgi:hypothetical protein